MALPGGFLGLGPLPLRPGASAAFNYVVNLQLSLCSEVWFFFVLVERLPTALIQVFRLSHCFDLAAANGSTRPVVWGSFGAILVLCLFICSFQLGSVSQLLPTFRLAWRSRCVALFEVAVGSSARGGFAGALLHVAPGPVLQKARLA